MGDEEIKFVNMEVVCQGCRGSTRGDPDRTAQNPHGNTLYHATGGARRRRKRLKSNPMVGHRVTEVVDGKMKRGLLAH